MLRPVGTTTFTQVSTEASPDGAVVFCAEELAIGNDALLATQVDTFGDPLWSPATLTVSSVASDNSSLDTESSSNGVALLAWVDQRAGNRDVIAQNVNADGTLGRACDLAMDGTCPTMMGFPPPFYVATGLFSDLAASGDFSLAGCAGLFTDSPSADPPSGDGRYYLARGTDHCLTYGDSSLAPDPRDDLDVGDPCP